MQHDMSPKQLLVLCMKFLIVCKFRNDALSLKQNVDYDAMTLVRDCIFKKVCIFESSQAVMSS